jgi:hypothetical protein
MPRRQYSLPHLESDDEFISLVHEMKILEGWTNLASSLGGRGQDDLRRTLISPICRLSTALLRVPAVRGGVWCRVLLRALRYRSLSHRPHVRQDRSDPSPFSVVSSAGVLGLPLWFRRFSGVLSPFAEQCLAWCCCRSASDSPLVRHVTENIAPSAKGGLSAPHQWRERSCSGPCRSTSRLVRAISLGIYAMAVLACGLRAIEIVA